MQVYELNNERRTPSSPRDYGLNYVHGTYVGFQDADDTYTPECCEKAAGFYRYRLGEVIRWLGNGHFTLRYRKAQLIRLGELKEILTIGLLTAVGQLCNVLRSLCLNRIFMALAGTLFVAAYSGQNTVSTLINSIGIGVGMTSLLICSVLVGEQDRTSLTQTMKANLKTAVFLNTCIAALVFAGADLLASLFGKGDPETRRLSAYILRVYACGLPVSIVSTVFQNFFQSMKKMKLVNFICVCQNFLFMVGYALLLPAVFGKNAVWLIFPLTHLTAVLLILGVSIAHN